LIRNQISLAGLPKKVSAFSPLKIMTLDKKTNQAMQSCVHSYVGRSARRLCKKLIKTKTSFSSFSFLHRGKEVKEKGATPKEKKEPKPKSHLVPGQKRNQREKDAQDVFLSWSFHSKLCPPFFLKIQCFSSGHRQATTD
jgi:hypothetical protein